MLTVYAPEHPLVWAHYGSGGYQQAVRIRIEELWRESVNPLTKG